MASNARGITRRQALKATAAAALATAFPSVVRAEERPPGSHDGWLAKLTAFLESHARGDGGYGWADQDRSHLTPTFAVVGCYRLLDRKPPDVPRLARYLRTAHPSQLKKLEQEHRIFDWQQVQALAWLRQDVAEFRERVRGWTKPVAYLKQYERNGNSVFRSDASVFLTRSLLGLPLDELKPHFTGYLDARRRDSGSFNNTPAADGSDGHVINTWWGLQALHVLGRENENKAATIEWLQSCQLPSGGFTWQPKPPFAGNDDAAYTWAALRSLALLGAQPKHREACIDWLVSLASADGGLGDRPRWDSNPMATYYALDALAALGALDALWTARRSALGLGAPSATRPVLPPDLQVFSIQLEAHGGGSPAEAVDLARSLRIHLWGAKNAKPEWIAAAQALADAGKVPVKFFVSNEEYGTWVTVPGLGTYSHTSDIIAAAAEIGPSLANAGVVTWPHYRDRRLAPLEKGGGRLIWQFGENEELVRLLLDDSLDRGGYAAISTFHFGNPDFTNTEPFLHRWRGRIPFVALQDAHGREPWWFADMTEGFRTLFLAAEPTWEGWLDALRHNRVVAVRHDAVSGAETWMHGPSRAVLDFVRERWRDWQWWDNPAIARPLVSMVVVRPNDAFEAGRIDNGPVLRIRCAWRNTTQGAPKQPLAELVRVTIDGAERPTKLTQEHNARGGALSDHYDGCPLDQLPPGEHVAAAVVRELETSRNVERTLRFTI